jgi:hypothetical protein
VAWINAASGEDAAGGLEARQGGFRVFGLYDPQEAEYSAGTGQAFHAAVAEPEGDEEAS